MHSTDKHAPDPTVAIFMVLWFFWAVFWFAVGMSGHGDRP
jgi:hypothetical protein